MILQVCFSSQFGLALTTQLWVLYVERWFKIGLQLFLAQWMELTLRELWIPQLIHNPELDRSFPICWLRTKCSLLPLSATIWIKFALGSVLGLSRVYWTRRLERVLLPFKSKFDVPRHLAGTEVGLNLCTNFFRNIRANWVKIMLYFILSFSSYY